MPTKLKSTGVEFPDGSIQTIAASGTPAGALQYFAMDTAPTGWLKANGAAISRTTYADLFSAIGTTFGAGNGSTTFNLPDLRGEFIRGWDDGRGVDSGRGFGSFQEDQFKSHNHNITAYAGKRYDNSLSFRSDRRNSHGWSTGDAGGDETRPRNIALLACIKY
jgi:phage-related tail fiber protein